ncbi:hypothetical protein GYMLUDRAFT_42532 [Collybiopsis luxurians FD-317 M1]|uniref:Cytosolic iron-sulfur protein assembly protein 1 n=1 Tax=Collybiopsis luxurians FD-317 M1 TaxID=944289 RepID=A0A0D0BD10_9AGAR|nr:hypothetical protein GYMLUDRAFT_42532 [Collybiopsis luxurians FD-317 M1]
MIQTGLLNNAHRDLVTCAAYDYYGQRLATCSLDQRVCVWALDDAQGWSLKDEWKAHDAPVACVAWAHPEFGDVIASAGFEGTVKIWERSVQGGGGWEEKAALVDARASVRQLEFAPNPFGLRLACVSADGWLRVYDCLEQNKLDAWLLAERLEVNPLQQTANNEEGAAVAIASPAPKQNQPAGTREADGGWCISWCKERWWGALLACTSGPSGVAKIFRLSPSQSPQMVLQLGPSNSSAISSVSWAPGCGRSYHLVATGGRDGHVRIWKVTAPIPDEDDEGDEADAKWESTLVADFDDHKTAAGGAGQVGKVEWNVTGTILSSTGSDGFVRLWKATTTSGGRIWRAKGSIGLEQRTSEKDKGNGNAMEE